MLTTQARKRLESHDFRHGCRYKSTYAVGLRLDASSRLILLDEAEASEQFALLYAEALVAT